ncbi:MAG: CPBP family intramembrane glutamic endopeptidase [Oscillospiraceae bacterium]
MSKSITSGQGAVSTTKKLIIFAAVMAAILGVTFSGRLIALVETVWLNRLLKCAVYAVMAITALVGMKLSGMDIKKQLDFKNAKQYLWALSVFAVLSLTVAVIPALFGNSLIGGHTEPSLPLLAYGALFYIGFVGPVEELVFRGYVQELFVEILSKHKWLGAVIAAAVFGLWHWINGSFVQVLFTFGIGLVFGLAKYFIKNCTLVSVALGHGLYDFMNIIIRIVLIK